MSLVLDYVEFLFGNLILAALAPPILFDAQGKHEPEHPSYKESLLRQVGKIGQSTSEAPDYLEVMLRDRTKIVIRLDAQWPPGPEMATPSGSGQFLSAWTRPR